MARAAANPAAKNYGTNILGIAAEQDDYFTPVELSGETPDISKSKLKGGTDATDPDYGLYPNVIEFRPPYSLTPVKEFYPVERYKGNPSPDPSIPGMQMGAGEIHFYLDATSAGFWLKHLLQTTDVASTGFGTYTPSTAIALTLAAGMTAGEFGAGSALLATDQPKAVIQHSTNYATVVADTDLFGDVANSNLHERYIDTSELPEGMTACQLKLTFATTSTADIQVSGRDHNGAPVSEVLSSTATRLTQTTKRYFADDVTVSKKGTGTLAVSAVDYVLSEVFEHKLGFVSDVSEGLTLEVREGNIDTPITYNGLLVSRGILTLEQVSRFRALVIANEAHPRTSMWGGTTGTKLKGREADSSATPAITELDPFDRLDFHAISAPGMSWKLSGPNLPSGYEGTFRVASMGFAIDNRIAPPRTAYAETFFYPKPVRKMNRELQLQVAIDYSKEADFDRFVGGLTFESTFSATSKIYADAYRGILVKGNQCQIVNNPTRIAGDLAEVLQQIVTRMHIGDDADGNDEAEITIINTSERL